MVGEQYTTLCRRLNELAPVVLDAEHQDAELTHIYLRREPHPELAWNTSLVEEYDEDEVKVWLRNRYDRFGASTKLTLPRLLASANSRAVLLSLREEGWLDWQILGAIAGIAMNYRVSREIDTRRISPERYRTLANRFMRETENAIWAEVPVELFRRERMLFQMSINVSSAIRGAGLVCRQQTPNEGAILEFVRHKMRYFEDDLPHDDILAEPA
jgi:hypothetical protein